MSAKPGVRTTEFWLTLLVATVGPIVTVLVSTGMFPAEGIEHVALIVANLTSLLAASKYVEVRKQIKEAAEIAAAAAQEAAYEHTLKTAVGNVSVTETVRSPVPQEGEGS